MVLIIFYFIIFVVFNVLNVNSIQISVNNEKDILDNLNSQKNDDIIFNILNISVNLLNQIDISNEYIEKISIIGNSKENSSINFTNNSNGFIFNSHLKEIYLKKITISGHLQFNNIKKVIIEDVILNGTIDFKPNCNNDETVEINNFWYNPASNTKSSCIRLFGNVNILNSYFYGSQICQDSILYYDGESKNSLSISDTNFDGAYLNNCLYINDAISSEISSSSFNNGGDYSGNGGGAIRGENSYINIKECEFKNNFSLTNGGVFHFYDSIVNADELTIYNSTASEKGGLIYLYSTNNNRTIVNINNSIQSETNNINQSKNFRGLIASVEGYSNLIMENFNGNDLNAGNGISAFTINKGSSIELKEIVLDNVSGSNVGGVLFTAYDEEIGSSFVVINGIFSNFYQNYRISPSSTFIWVNEKINILIQE
ncbi:hypothetical protein PIROE2DRAFT_19329 [Piromyces sp. E2]|nr:hypothetical protein PIROE2DRAFT_19329 [Piromyces sp. E2]|eukprot:OUM56181.1 hypothetical protein PIROE2DRAFT_19329 [Piromyces sp. E2]